MRFNEIKDLTEDFKVSVPTGRVGPQVADIQKVLEALGYDIGPNGVDGVRGPYTSAAIKQFQQDYSLRIDGDPGTETVTEMNKLIAQLPGKFMGLFPSTKKDVQLNVKKPGYATKGYNPVRSTEISNYLKSKGMSDAHRRGILVNIQRESGFDSAALGDNGTSGGLFQHHNERFTAMKTAVGSNDWQSNWQGQIDFALSEPAGRQYLHTYFRTPEQAAAWWVKHFEKPANQSREIAIRTGLLKNYA